MSEVDGGRDDDASGDGDEGGVDGERCEKQLQEE